MDLPKDSSIKPEKIDKIDPAQLQKELLDQQKKLALQEKMIKDYTDQLQRLQAEFENFQKRIQKDHALVQSHANEKLVVRLLSVLDDFEHALAHVKSKEDPVIIGFEGIYKNLVKTLHEFGLSPIACKGEKFDPFKHEVLVQVEDNSVFDGCILEELQKGYVLNNKVIRFAKVRIAKGKK